MSMERQKPTGALTDSAYLDVLATDIEDAARHGILGGQWIQISHVLAEDVVTRLRAIAGRMKGETTNEQA